MKELFLSNQLIERWAAQFFPHLTPQYAFLAVVATLAAMQAKTNDCH